MSLFANVSLPKTGRTGAVVRHMRRCIIPGGLILLYHRTADLEADPNWLSVPPQRFAAHLALIRKYARPISMRDMVSAVRERRLPRRSVAITFDDGYADNLYAAKPLLEQFDIPATVFVTSGFLKGDREFWWDELERILLGRRDVPGTFHFDFNGRRTQWEFHGSGYDPTQFRTWHIRKSDETARHGTFRAIFSYVHDLPTEVREDLMSRLREWAGVTAEPRSTHRGMTPGELRMLSDGIIDVGGHSVAHPALAHLSVQAQAFEVNRSKAVLEEILGHSVDGFAYPHGSYTDETVRCVSDAGYVYGCTTAADLAWPGADLYRLPRLLVRDWDVDTFERKLRRWLA